MVVGDLVVDVLGPILECLEPIVPGEWFPLYFIRPYLQRPLIAAIFVSMVAGFLGSFLLIRNLALIGDGLAHVSFGAIAIGLVAGVIDPLIWAFIISMVAAILINYFQVKQWLTGDTAIAIFFLDLRICQYRGECPLPKGKLDSCATRLCFEYDKYFSLINS